MAQEIQTNGRIVLEGAVVSGGHSGSGAQTFFVTSRDGDEFGVFDNMTDANQRFLDVCDYVARNPNCGNFWCTGKE